VFFFFFKIAECISPNVPWSLQKNGKTKGVNANEKWWWYERKSIYNLFMLNVNRDSHTNMCTAYEYIMSENNTVKR